MFLEKGVVKLCSKFTGEHSCRSVTSFYKNSYGGLLLSFIKLIYVIIGLIYQICFKAKVSEAKV